MPVVKITNEEINERIRLSHQRMGEPFYQIENVFSLWDKWPGDKAGRALLAFVSLADCGMEKIPCMDTEIDELPGVMNEKGYLGAITEDFFEQQLSGHSWLLRGLCAYYEKYGDKRALDMAMGIVDNLYMPLKGKICDYPLYREDGEKNGGVDGHNAETHDGWILSTDTCCAFMSIDGLSHVYKITKSEKVKELLDEMITKFMSIDKQEIKAQTHCTLTAARGIMRLYSLTDNRDYLAYAENILDIYVKYGMTYNYENYNWWGRPDSWTEPCAIIDSLMLSCELYKATGKEDYRVLAARIYHNGFPALQRPNGGAGTQSIVYEGLHELYSRTPEAKQCCTMRLGEGLKYIYDNRDLLYAETTGEVTKDSRGVYTDGDIIYSLTVGEEEKGLHPLTKYYKLTVDFTTVKQRLVFINEEAK